MFQLDRETQAPAGRGGKRSFAAGANQSCLEAKAAIGSGPQSAYGMLPRSDETTKKATKKKIKK